MNNSELYSKRIVFESCGVSRPEFCAIVIPFLFFVFGIAIFLSNSVYGHYPFPCSEQEKEKAKEIDRAEKKCDQEGVDVLIEFLGDENPRVRTAAFLSLIYLSASGFNMEIAVPVRGVVELTGAELVSGTTRTTLGHLKGARDTQGRSGGSESLRTLEYVVRVTDSQAVFGITVLSEKGGRVRRDILLRSREHGAERPR